MIIVSPLYPSHPSLSAPSFFPGSPLGISRSFKGYNVFNSHMCIQCVLLFSSLYSLLSSSSDIPLPLLLPDLMDTFSFKHTEFRQCCQCSLSHAKKANSAFLSSHCWLIVPPIRLGHHESLSHSCWDFGWSLIWSSAYHPSCSEFLCAMALLCPTNTVSLQSSISLNWYHLSAPPHLQSWSEPWKKKIWHRFPFKA